MIRHRVPKAMEPIFQAVTAITDEFCRVHQDGQYAALARKAAATLARKSSSPLARGNAESWAGGILYALAKVNHLGGGEGQPFSSLGELCDLLGIGRSTTGTAKDGEVIAALKIRPLECEWLHPDVLADDPRAWLLDVGGMVVDARQLPPDMQQQVSRLGLIPFVPSDPSSRKVVGERDAVLAEYQRWRRLNTDIQNDLASQIMIDGTAIKQAVKLGIARTPAAALGLPLDKLAPAFDLAIYGGKLPQQQLAAKPAHKGQRATMLKAMAAATFSLFEVIDLYPAAGLRLRDLSDDHEVWLIDRGLELSAPKGVMLATRVIKPADFAMTTGVSVNMTDAV